MAAPCKPALVIHGGAGAIFLNRAHQDIFANSQREIVQEAFKRLRRGQSAVHVCAWAVETMENEPIYNAGKGSKIQSDGKIRLSASLMDGKKRRFGGCINVRAVKNPIRLAQLLMNTGDRVLAEHGAEIFAKQHGLAKGNPYTAESRAIFLRGRPGRSGTVGAVALDKKGSLAAATSTGGRGWEYPHRVSDCPTVAGNFANQDCAVSATGVGEQIVEFALAARICALVEGGLPLRSVAQKLLREAKSEDCEFGFIALTKAGDVFAGKTTKNLVWAAARGLNDISTFGD